VRELGGAFSVSSSSVAPFTGGPQVRKQEEVPVFMPSKESVIKTGCREKRKQGHYFHQT
jgi:hypothetical protein